MAISRYRGLKILKDSNNISYLETMEYPNININAIPHFDYLMGQGERLDFIAHKFWGDGKYWWIIALVNNVAWPWDLKAGDLIKIPQSLDNILELF